MGVGDLTERTIVPELGAGGCVSIFSVFTNLRSPETDLASMIMKKFFVERTLRSSRLC